MSIDYLMAKQKMKLKSSLIDMDDKCNKFFPSFSFFNDEFIPGEHLVNTFSDHFSFYSHTLNIQKHMENLKENTIRASSDLFLSIIMSNASIKNQVAISILHIHSFNKPIIVKFTNGRLSFSLFYLLFLFLFCFIFLFSIFYF